MVTHPKKGKYIVNKKGQILSVQTGNFVFKGSEDGNRKNLLSQAKELFEEKSTKSEKKNFQTFEEDTTTKTDPKVIEEKKAAIEKERKEELENAYENSQMSAAEDGQSDMAAVESAMLKDQLDSLLPPQDPDYFETQEEYK